MSHVRRTVRFCLNGQNPLPQRPDVTAKQKIPRYNNHSAWPPMRGLGRYYELHVGCEGTPDPVTGYLINIKRIDQAVQENVLDHLEMVIAKSDQPATIPMGQLMQDMIRLVDNALDGAVTDLGLQLTPLHRLEICKDGMAHVFISQFFEFSAAHRLHVGQLSDDENRQFFGKCNNATGHGHNYRLEVTIEAPIDERGQVLLVEQLDALVHDAVIQKLDHKNLNLDVPEFADRNPSVENIAEVIYQLINDRIQDLGVALDQVRVWETQKTVCTYRGDTTASVGST